MGKVGQAGSYSAEAWDLSIGIPHGTGEPHFPDPKAQHPFQHHGCSHNEVGIVLH